METNISVTCATVSLLSFSKICTVYSTNYFLLFLSGRGHAPQQGLVPGKVISFWNGFFYPLFGVEHHLDKDFDVLCTKTPEKFKWVAAKGCKYFSRLALV